MTYSELMSKATPEQRQEVYNRVTAIIGKEEVVVGSFEKGKDFNEWFKARQAWDRGYERLAKVFFEHGAKALAMNFTQMGWSFKGVTASGKKWTLDANNGWTERSRYCGTLWIEGEGTIFTSGRLDKVFDYILQEAKA